SKNTRFWNAGGIDLTLDAALAFEWAVVNMDPMFLKKLPKATQSLVEQHEFPKYSLLSVSACIELVRSSNVLSIVPEAAIEYLSDRDQFVLTKMPVELNFRVSAVTLNEGWEERMVKQFIKICNEI
ncbi:MAG: hypothetical protein ACPG07_08315, partial [Henriciella sp.]